MILMIDIDIRMMTVFEKIKSIYHSLYLLIS